MRNYLVCIATIFFFGTGGVKGENIYIAQTAQGSDNGAGAANAHAAAWFNTAANWGTGAGKIGPGDTVHVCGTITGAVGATILTFQGSGTSGNPITLKWEAGASLTCPQCNGVGTGGNSYLIIDGNGTANSIINTASGSSRAYQNGGAGVFAGTYCNNCEIKNLSIVDMFVHDQFTDHTNGNGEGIGAAGNNLSIHDNRIVNAFIGIDLYTNNESVDNLQIYNNDISKTNWGIDVPSSNDWSVSHAAIHDNHLHDMANWDSDNDAFHRDGIFLRHNPDGGGAGYVTDIYIYNNLFDGSFSNCCGTAWIFYNSHQNRIYIFNNILINGGGGFLLEGGLTGDQNFYVVNNVLDGNGGAMMNYSHVSGFWVENNIFTNMGSNFNYFNGNTNTTFDYNVYRNYSSGEAHSLNTANENLNSSYMPNAGSPVIQKGTNLTSLGIPLLNVDRAGNPRPSSGSWDIGAYEYVAGTSVIPSVTDRQAALHATIHLHGMSFTVMLPSSAQSPELTVIDLSGQTVFRAMLNNTGESVYNCAWHRAPAAGIYFAIIKEAFGDKDAVLARTKIVVGK